MAQTTVRMTTSKRPEFDPVHDLQNDYVMATGFSFNQMSARAGVKMFARQVE
jgi:hypothetical protein